MSWRRKPAGRRRPIELSSRSVISISGGDDAGEVTLFDDRSWIRDAKLLIDREAPFASHTPNSLL
jgi:hypothetical protein